MDESTGNTSSDAPQHQQCDLNCLNGGTCLFGYNLDQFCTCRLGYSGILCQERILKCGEDHVCYNGAPCIHDDVDKPYCDCSAISSDEKAYGGHLCQLETTSFCNYTTTNSSEDEYNSIMDSSFLQIGNESVNNSDHYVMIPIVGPIMQRTTFCFRDGTCPSKPHMPCACPTGYGGSHCQFSKHELESKEYANCSLHCKNGGQCTHDEKNGGSGIEHCSCPPGFAGLECEFPYILCSGRSDDNNSTMPCFHGSTCGVDNTSGEPICQCNQDNHNPIGCIAGKYPADAVVVVNTKNNISSSFTHITIGNQTTEKGVGGEEFFLAEGTTTDISESSSNLELSPSLSLTICFILIVIVIYAIYCFRNNNKVTPVVTDKGSMMKTYNSSSNNKNSSDDSNHHNSNDDNMYKFNGFYDEVWFGDGNITFKELSRRMGHHFYDNSSSSSYNDDDEEAYSNGSEDKNISDGQFMNQNNGCLLLDSASSLGRSTTAQFCTRRLGETKSASTTNESNDIFEFGGGFAKNNNRYSSNNNYHDNDNKETYDDCFFDEILDNCSDVDDDVDVDNKTKNHKNNNSKDVSNVKYFSGRSMLSRLMKAQFGKQASFPAQQQQLQSLQVPKRDHHQHHHHHQYGSLSSYLLDLSSSGRSVIRRFTNRLQRQQQGQQSKGGMIITNKQNKYDENKNPIYQDNNDISSNATPNDIIELYNGNIFYDEDYSYEEHDPLKLTTTSSSS